MIRPLPVGILTIAGDDPDLAMTVAVTGRSLQRRISAARSAPTRSAVAVRCSEPLAGNRCAEAPPAGRSGSNTSVPPLTRTNRSSSPASSAVNASGPPTITTATASRTVVSMRPFGVPADNAGAIRLRYPTVNRASSSRALLTKVLFHDGRASKTRIGRRVPAIVAPASMTLSIAGALTVERNRFNPQCSRAEIERPPRNVDRRGRR